MQELKASEKKVLKMSKDGAALQNLVTNTTEKVSKRMEEAVLKKEVSPELLAKYKAAGIEKPTPNRRQYTNLKFGKNNPDKPTEDDNPDHQQSEQTVSAVMPVVSISFTPKKVDKEFLTRNVNKQRKEQRKLNNQLAKEQQTESETDNPEDSPDTPVQKESKLKDRKTRNTLKEHSSSADSLNEESEDSALTFESEADAVDVAENPETKPKTKAETTDLTEVPEAPDVPTENAVPLSKEDKRLSKKVGKDEKKLAKAERRLEKAENKLPTETVVTFEKKLDTKSGKYKRKLRFEKEVKPSDRKLPLGSGAKGVKQTVKTTVSGSFHNQIAKYEEENPTLKAAHSTEKVAESALHTADSAMKTAYQNHKTAPYRKVSKLKFQKEKAEQKLSYHKALSENPELRSGGDKKAAAKAAMKKAQQKQNQKKAAKETKKAAEKVKEAAEEVGKKIVEAIASNKWVIIIIVVVLIIFALFGTLCTSCCSSFVDNGTVLIATTYTSKDEDIYAENALSQKSSILSSLKYSLCHSV